MTREPTDLVPVTANRPPDPYERKFMAGQGTVLYRDKHRAPWPLHAIMGASALAVIVAAVATGELISLAIGLPVLAIVWLLFSVLRVTVSAGTVNVQYGLFGPEIPMAAIESAAATTYDWKKFGGWGTPGPRDDGWSYNMRGDGGRAVRIVWRDPQGRRVVTLIGSPQHEQLAAQIHGARAALPAAPEAKALGSGD